MLACVHVRERAAYEFLSTHRLELPEQLATEAPKPYVFLFIEDALLNVHVSASTLPTHAACALLRPRQCRCHAAASPLRTLTLSRVCLRSRLVVFIHKCARIDACMMDTVCSLLGC